MVHLDCHDSSSIQLRRSLASRLSAKLASGQEITIAIQFVTGVASGNLETTGDNASGETCNTAIKQTQTAEWTGKKQ
jgi:hypothetical protein